MNGLGGQAIVGVRVKSWLVCEKSMVGKGEAEKGRVAVVEVDRRCDRRGDGEM